MRKFVRTTDRYTIEIEPRCHLRRWSARPSQGERSRHYRFTGLGRTERV